ncbi:MAG: alanine racemase [Deltaproteobacteria bacterium]|nr:alanine racemase [Deltaproteobacteria bacterium]
MNSYRPSYCEINLAALRHNLRELQKKAGIASLLPMIKANAYGHGAVNVAQALMEEKVKGLGVALFEEALQLREAGIKCELFCFGGLLGASPQDFFHHQITPVIFQPKDLKILIQEKVELSFQLKVDTGMGRLGFFSDEIPAILAQIEKAPHLKLQGLLTHLARADENDPQPSQNQIENFLSLKKLLRQKGKNIPCYHLANSAALIEKRLNQTDWARPGIALYGAYPHERLQKNIQLQPLLAWKSQIISLKDFPSGSPLSYGATFICPRPSRIAVMALGYADGYSRQFSNCGKVLVCGQKAPVVGRVCMDLTLIDVTDIPQAQLGSEVVVLGKQQGEELKAEELAQKINTISYEIFCGISARVPRVYLK